MLFYRVVTSKDMRLGSLAISLVVIFSLVGCLDDVDDNVVHSCSEAQFVLEEGEHVSCGPMQLEKDTNYRFEWETEYKDSEYDSDLDIFFMTQLNYQNYKDGDAFSYKGGVSKTAVKTYSN